MNSTMSFYVKNRNGAVSLARILKIQPSGACYIDYEKKNETYHFSLHPPVGRHNKGQKHIKVDGEITSKWTVDNFEDINKPLPIESIIILEPELIKRTSNSFDTTVELELSENQMAHIILIRSGKDNGSIKSAFISDSPTGGNNTPYPVFYSIENLPDANYYLTHCITPIPASIKEFVANYKKAFIASGQIIDANANHILQVRYPFLETDIEMCISPADIAEYTT